MHLGLGRYRLGVGMRRPGFEPGLWAWKAQVIPLDHRRTFAFILPYPYITSLNLKFKQIIVSTALKASRIRLGYRVNSHGCHTDFYQ